jgi:hypothetical protein
VPYFNEKIVIDKYQSENFYTIEVAAFISSEYFARMIGDSD